MKNFLYILLLSITIYSCDDRDKFIEGLDVAPNMSYTNGTKFLTDSIKLSLKNSQVKYTTSVNISDNDNNLKNITYKIQSNSGKVYIDDELKTSSEFTVTKPVFKFSYEPKQIGYERITLTAIDKLDKASTILLELYGFNNLPPKAVFTASDVTKLGVLDNFEYLIDASKCYDQDQKFGGAVIQYKYKINSEEYIINKNQLRTIFPKEGSYNIEVSVLDNDGTWSQAKSAIVDIN